jgi:hypothetical protein
MSNLESVLRAFTRQIIVGAFWIASRLSFTIEIHGLAYDTKVPRTYIALLHKRDLDPIITIPIVLSHRGWRAMAGDVHFALRSDAFSPGYLAHLVQRPRWFARLLHPISLRSVLPWLGANPVEHLHIRPIEEWIRELLSTEGDMRAGNALSSTVIQELATTTGQSAQHIEDFPISRLLSWRYEPIIQRAYGPEVFIGQIRRRAEQRLLKMAKQHLADLSTWLESGGSIYGAPEGRLSPDGTLGPITASLHRVLHAGPSDTRVVPMSIIYDFMTVRRLHIFVDFAPAIEHAPTLPTGDLDAQLRTAWLRSARFTCTQLGSSFLMQRSHSGALAFTVDDLARELERQATDLAAAGRHVDARLLRSRDACKVAEGFLAYALRRGLIRRVDDRKWISIAHEERIEVWAGEVGYDRMPLTYAMNELQEMLSVDLIVDRHN